MCLHHFLTVSLLCGMIMQNFLRIGIVVAWVHSCSDCWTSISRVFSNIKYKGLTEVTFILCTAVWMYFRNYCMPLITYLCWTRAIYPPELEAYQAAPTILSGMLIALCVMHVYWLFLFFKIIYQGIVTG